MFVFGTTPRIPSKTTLRVSRGVPQSPDVVEVPRLCVRRRDSTETGSRVLSQAVCEVTSTLCTCYGKDTERRLYRNHTSEKGVGFYLSKYRVDKNDVLTTVTDMSPPPRDRKHVRSRVTPVTVIPTSVGIIGTLPTDVHTNSVWDRRRRYAPHPPK